METKFKQDDCVTFVNTGSANLDLRITRIAGIASSYYNSLYDTWEHHYIVGNPNYDPIKKNGFSHMVITEHCLCKCGHKML